MADDNVMTMVARLKYEAPAEFKMMQQQFQNAARNPGLRDLHHRFSALRDVLTPLTGVLKDTLMPMLNTLGITSLSVVGVMGGLATGMQKFASGALGLKVFADQVRLTTDEVHKIIDAAEESNVSTEEMIQSLGTLGKTFLEMTAGPDQSVTGGALDLYAKMIGFGQRALDQFGEIQEHLRAFPGDTAGAYRMIFEAMDKMKLTPDKRALWLQAWGLSTKLADDHLKKIDEIQERVHVNLETAKEFSKEWHAFGREIDDVGKTIFNIIGPTLTKIIAGMREFMADWEKSPPPWWFSQFMSLALNETTGAIAGQIARTPLVTNQSWGDWLMRGPQNTLQPRGSGDSVFGGPTGGGASTFQDQRTREGGQLPSDRFSGAAPSGPGAPAPTAPGAAPPTPFSQRFGGWEGGGAMRVPSTGEVVPGSRPAPIQPGQQGPIAPGQQGAHIPSGATGSEYLRAQRASFTQELERDPGVRKELAALTTLEHESDPVAVVESLANRHAYVNEARAKQGLPPLSVRDMIHGAGGKSFYGPVRRGLLGPRMTQLERNPDRLARMNAAIAEVSSGSNILKGATDQGSPGDPNAQHPGGRIVRQGEVYNDWGGGPGSHEGARRFREEQQRRVQGEAPTSNPASTVNTGPTGPKVRTAGLGNVIEAQGGIRRLPLASQTRGYLDYASRMTGLGVEVGSGGQPSTGPNRTGSHRHDWGGAADLKLFEMVDGKKRYLDMRNPEDQARMQEFVKHSVSAGATGVGAGMGYMGAQTIHVGGGTPASWGGAPWIERARQEGLRTSRSRLDELLSATTGATEPKGAADLNIDVKAPRGTTVEAESRGVFNETKINRSMKGDKEEAKSEKAEDKEEVE